VSVDEIGWVWRSSPYSGTAKLIHLKMAQWANEGHEWMLYCGDAVLAQAAACNRRTVERAKAQMVEDGYLEDLHERHANGNRLYRFLMPGTDQCDKLSDTNATSRPTNATFDPSSPLIEPKEEKASTRRRRAPELPFPSGRFLLTGAMSEWARKENLGHIDLRAETAKFKDHALANDRRCRDWVAAWRNWIRNAAKWQPAGPATRAGTTDRYGTWDTEHSYVDRSGQAWEVCGDGSHTMVG